MIACAILVYFYLVQIAYPIAPVQLDPPIIYYTYNGECLTWEIVPFTDGGMIIENDRPIFYIEVPTGVYCEPLNRLAQLEIDAYWKFNRTEPRITTVELLHVYKTELPMVIQ